MSKEKKKIRLAIEPFFYLKILFFMFLFLKLGEFGVVKYWSWWFVTAPLWVPMIFMSVTTVMVFFGVLIHDIAMRLGRWKLK